MSPIEEGQIEVGHAPFGRLGKHFHALSLEEHVFRGCCGHAAVSTLRIGYLPHLLTYHAGQIKIRHKTLTIEIVLLQPTQLLPMRTIGEDRLHIALHSRHNNAVRVVKKRI